MSPIKKVLIANRGEIACRIIDTCRRLNVRTVAVYSDADRRARHVRLADEAVHIGAAEPTASYLNIEALLLAVQQSGADAVHPGYGFLSEKAEFARALEAAGVRFIGPPVAAIELMGSKSAAKATMEAAGVPCVPGYHGEDQRPEHLQREAERIGYPVLIKAVSGGGGKGMKIVHNAAEFNDALASAQREASKAFGDATVLLEKYISNPRHIEVQVFADAHGGVVHLFERDCSTQRRYQKIIEEAPASSLHTETLGRMHRAAVEAAGAIGYCGAGTVEFIVDADQSFYFMEMNTRLQVEHRVTEQITGEDLVAWQLRVAGGERLPKSQSELAVRGHSIQVRIYAEDPEAGFLPSTGRIQQLQWPELDHGLIDTGVEAGSEIGIHYDPMIAKLVVWGRDRDEALERVRDGLARCVLFGVQTNLAYLSRLLRSEAFVQQRLFTNSIDDGQIEFNEPDAQQLAGALARALVAESAGDGVWQSADQWRLQSPAPVHLHFRHGGEMQEMHLTWADVQRARQPEQVHRHRQQIHLLLDGVRHELTLADSEAAQLALDAGERITAPMPGKIIEVRVAKGDRVHSGEALVVMEAMKMELKITAPADAEVAEVNVKVGEQVAAEHSLIEFVT